VSDATGLKERNSVYFLKFWWKIAKGSRYSQGSAECLYPLPSGDVGQDVVPEQRTD